MTPIVTIVVALAALGVVALATLELWNGEWRYSRERGLYVQRVRQRSQAALGLSLVILAVFGVAPQLLIVLTVLDPAQPSLSRIISAGEILLVVGWIALVLARLGRKPSS